MVRPLKPQYRSEFLEVKKKKKPRKKPRAGVEVAMKHHNFPAVHKKPYDQRKVRIQPSHRVIYENYKNQGFRNLGKAIRDTGAFSDSVARRVNVITNTKSWQALMDEKMPEEHLATRHKELLDKRDTIKVYDDEGNVSFQDAGPNTSAVTKGLDMAYKLRGAYKEKEPEAPSTVMYNLFYKPEIRAQMKTFEEGIKQQLVHEIARKNQKDIEEEEQLEENKRIINEQRLDGDD